MASLDITQVGFVSSAIDRFNAQGINTGRIINRSALRYFDLDNKASYIPTNGFYSVLEHVSKEIGVEGVGRVITMPDEMLELTPFLAMALVQPDLLTITHLISKFDQIGSTNLDMNLQVNGNLVKWSFGWRDEPSFGRDLLEIFTLNLVLNVLDLVIGKNYIPSEIHLQGNTKIHLGGIIPNDNKVKLYLNQPSGGVVFPASLLSSSNSFFDVNSEVMDFDLPESNTSRIHKILNSNRAGFVPSFDQVSSFTDVSQSTLRRMLAGEGTSYSEIVDNWRFKSAMQMMEDPRLEIKDVCEHLRYANLANFNRAFHRWTSTSPTKYRELL